MIWHLKHPKATPDMLGYIPSFLSEDNPRPAREQINTAYAHGGGFQPFIGFKMLPDGSLKYPDDPPTLLLAETTLRHETIRFYQHSWLAIIQPDGTFEITRVD
jgi:hypothetical protein